MNEYDVIVIGGGAAGTCCLLRHKEAGNNKEEFDGEITIGVQEQKPILQEEQINNAFEQEN